MTCEIVNVGKRRDGGSRFWCLSHHANATAKYGVAAAEYRGQVHLSTVRGWFARPMGGSDTSSAAGLGFSSMAEVNLTPVSG